VRRGAHSVEGAAELHHEADPLIVLLAQQLAPPRGAQVGGDALDHQRR
jgi:hypothetical protein